MQLPALPPERASAASRRKPRVGVAAPGFLALFLLAGALTALLGAVPAAHAQTPVWTQEYDYHGDNECTPAKIARDSAGNIYAAGQRFYNSINTDYDALLAKYDAAGTLVWSRNVDGPHFTGVTTSRYDSADKVIVDGSNNIYIAVTCPHFMYQQES